MAESCLRGIMSRRRKRQHYTVEDQTTQEQSVKASICCHKFYRDGG